MIIALDVQYHEKPDGTESARGAAVAFNHWSDAAPVHEWTVKVEAVKPYVPGRFFERELPCLLELLEGAPCPVDIVIVDGHVWLDAGRPGLGHHLRESLDSDATVIGVAKSRFREGHAVEVLRGKSRNPLHVTAIGCDDGVAAAHVRAMHGPYRIPTLLKRVDGLARGYIISP